ncbi:MAG: hypothetical protein QG657_4095 [Acidobacteriota bacterium]|nr:hypothetical protein [Acidobacteriota bacterium]
MIFILSVVLFCGVNFFMSAQEEVAQDAGADKTHQALKKLPKQLLEMIKLTEEEAAQTTRGEKLKVYEISFIKLGKFKAGDNAKALLIHNNEIVYPIYVGNELKTALSVRKVKNEWQTASMGSGEIQFLEKIRKEHAQANKLNLKSYYIVRVGALYMSFLGYDKGNEMVLIPTHESQDTQLVVGKEMPADDVFTRIQKLLTDDQLHTLGDADQIK